MRTQYYFVQRGTPLSGEQTNADFREPRSLAHATLADMWNRQQHHDVREALFGGRACVRVWDLAPNPATPFAAVLACELEAGGRVGAHVQEHFPEIVIGVEGAGSVLVNGARLEFGSGRVVEVPLGQTLAISNDSAQEPLRYLIVKARRAASE